MKISIAMAGLVALSAAIAPPSSLGAKQQSSSTEPGQSVWDGVYTREQASRGAALYAERCAHCHGQDLTGGEIAPALNGGEFKSNWSGLSVDDLFERIKVSMPQDNPGSLSRQQTADVLAFVLFRNGFPVGKTELAREAEVAKQIRFEQNRPETAGTFETPKQPGADGETPSATVAGAYHEIEKIPNSGNAGWDYRSADREARRLYFPSRIEAVTLGNVTGYRAEAIRAPGICVYRMPNSPPMY